jgi:proton-translocating NADH-quinone oxidoreductase chain L
MYLSLIFLPLIGAFIAGFFGRFLGKQGAILITTILVSLSALFSFIVFYEVVLCHSVCSFKLFTWMESNSLIVSWGFLFDSLTATMLVVVTFVSSLVHLYSAGYMSEDPHLPRFMSYLSFFTFCMLMLVTADNYVQMFLGWEGVGLASYLLINFWYTRIQANKSAMKAMIVNKIGDFGLSLGIALIFFSFSSFDFSVIFNVVPLFLNEKFIFMGFAVDKLTLISLLLFVGAVGKSAQIGLHTWLPDAMEGPTPVSALIHAATMVTAGVFVVLRSSPILEYSNFSLLIITIIGSLTAFMAATIGVVQNDLKKVIAYSTCSQLGYMILACGLSNYSIGLFHLMNHAFFKALLFLSAGSVIHAMADEQDMRKMGGLVKVIPITYVMIVIGSLALMGFPFLTGFYSKDILLELTFGTYHISGIFAYWLGTLSAFFTSFYSIRLIYLTFLKSTSSSKTFISHAHESSTVMLIPLFALCFGSIFVGFLAKDLFLGLGVDTWNSSLFQLITHVSFFEAEFLPFQIKLIPFIFSMSGLLLAVCIYQVYEKNVISLNIYKRFYYIYSFFSKKWYFDNIYNTYIVNNILSFGYHISFKLIDRGLIELIGPLGITRGLSTIIDKTSKFQSGLIYHYIFTMILGVTFFILLFTLPVFFKTSLLIIFSYFFLYSNFVKKS